MVGERRRDHDVFDLAEEARVAVRETLVVVETEVGTVLLRSGADRQHDDGVGTEDLLGLQPREVAQEDGRHQRQCSFGMRLPFASTV